VFWIIVICFSFNTLKVLPEFSIIKTSSKLEVNNYPNNLNFSMEQDSWTRTWGGKGNEFATAMAIDSQDNIYVAGHSRETGSTVLLKYNSSGHLLWNRTWKKDDPKMWPFICIDSQDNIYLAGRTDGAISDIYIVKYDPTGNIIWDLTWGEEEIDEYCLDIEVDSFDHIYVAGITAVNYVTDVFLIEYNSTGNIQSSNIWNYKKHDEFHDICFDSSNNMYISINTELLKYNITGNLEWTYLLNSILWFPQEASDNYLKFTIDNNDDIIVANEFSDLIKINNSGNLIWFFNRTGDRWNYTLSGDYLLFRKIITDPSDNIYLLGEKIAEETDYCPGGFCICHFYNTYIENYNVSGDFLWNRQCSGCGRYLFTDIALDTNNNIYICGYDYSCCVSDADFILIKNPKPFNGTCITRFEYYISKLLIILIGSFASLILSLMIYGIYKYLKKRGRFQSNSV